MSEHCDQYMYSSLFHDLFQINFQNITFSQGKPKLGKMKTKKMVITFESTQNNKQHSRGAVLPEDPSAVNFIMALCKEKCSSPFKSMVF